MHRDIVFDVPAGCTNLATSPICGVQGLYMPQRVLSVQGHPEFHKGIMSPLLELRHASGLFNDELYKDALSRAGNYHDGRLIAKAMVKFIVEAQSSKS
jgi:GMP synthase (glutamine-hydrolysing)